MFPDLNARTFTLGLACTTIIVSGFLIALLVRPAEGDPVLDATELEFLILLNAYREANDLAPVMHDPRLTSASEWLANDQANNNYVGHTDSLNRATTRRMEDIVGAPLPYGGIAENVSAGRPTAQKTLEGWKNAPPHNRTLLGDFNAIGIARICKSNTTYGCYWATNFGKATGPIPTTAAPTTAAPTESPNPSPTGDGSATPGASSSLTASPSPTPIASSTPTPSPSASPIQPEAPGFRRNGENTLVVPMAQGDDLMFISTAGALGVVVGDFVVINPDGDTEEVFEITDVSPLTLNRTATFAHDTDELVEQIHRGDSDCNRQVTGADVVAALAEVADLDPDELCQPMANADCSGSVDETDSLWILLRAAGMAAFEAVNCSPVGGGLPASTLVQVATPAGTDLIEPLSMSGFHIGDTIRINPGGANEEDNVITGIGSFVLQSVLLFSHDAGEPITKVLEVPDFVVPTTTPSPSPDPTPSPTASPTPTPTETPIPTDTPSPTLTDTPTPTDSATPTDTPV